jgi:ATP-dependent protease ClpP protease subunit
MREKMKEKQSAFLKDITSLSETEFNELLIEDFIEEAEKAKQIIQNLIDQAQDLMNAKVEKLVDSFGGDVSARELAGD